MVSEVCKKTQKTAKPKKHYFLGIFGNLKDAKKHNFLEISYIS